MNEREFDLILIGVTGLVGKLTDAPLANHAPDFLRTAIGGRNKVRFFIRSVYESRGARPKQLSPTIRPSTVVCPGRGGAHVLARITETETERG